jgi:hypothetical protein
MANPFFFEPLFLMGFGLMAKFGRVENLLHVLTKYEISRFFQETIKRNCCDILKSGVTRELVILIPYLRAGVA